MCTSHCLSIPCLLHGFTYVYWSATFHLSLAWPIACTVVRQVLVASFESLLVVSSSQVVIIAAASGPLKGIPRNWLGGPQSRSGHRG
jgi:hypothetical protein